MVGGNDFAGYLVVVDIPGKPGQPIALSQIESAISGNQSKSLGKAKSVKKPDAKPQEPTAKKPADSTSSGSQLAISSDPSVRFSPISDVSTLHSIDAASLMPPKPIQETTSQTALQPLPLSY